MAAFEYRQAQELRDALAQEPASRIRNALQIEATSPLCRKLRSAQK
jgi:hypothetical protein